MQSPPAAPLLSPRAQRNLMIVLLVIGLLLTAFFGLRAVRSFVRLERARHAPLETDVSAIRGWMTIPFISHQYAVPEPELYRALGVPPHGYERASLSEINQEFFAGQPQAALEVVKAAILEFQARHAQPPEPPKPGDPPKPPQDGDPPTPLPTPTQVQPAAAQVQPALAQVQSAPAQGQP